MPEITPPRRARTIRPLLRRLIALSIGLACCIFGSNGAALAADRTGTVRVDGKSRSFVIHAPDGPPPGQKLPLVLAFHGGGMQGAGMARITGLDAIADRRHFVVVYPDGWNKHWNDGRLSIRDPQDDVGFVSALLDQLERTQPVDNRRVFATGISNGALFVQRLGCALSDRIAGIAPVAGPMPAAIVRSCRPANAVAVLQIDGTADPIMPFNGGEVADFGGRGEGGVVTSVRETGWLWARLNNCAGVGPPQMLPPVLLGDPTRIVRTAFTACPADGTVALLQVTGGGHVWPGGRQPYRPRITGQPSRQIDASATIADFFLGLPARQTRVTRPAR